MRKRVLVCVISVIMIYTAFLMEIPIHASAQGTEDWIALHNGSYNGHDGAYDLAIGPSGTIYVTGSSWGIGTGTDCDTVAYDQDGNELWSATYDEPGGWGDSMFAITVDSSEKIYVTGTSHNQMTHYDYVTISYDSDGNELWTARYNGPGNSGDRAWAIVADNSGCVYITGESNGNPYNEDYATIKYDSSGNQVWVARWSGPSTGTERALAIALDSLGNVYVTGIGHYGDTRWDYTTIKYDSMGNELWIARYSAADYGLEGGKAIATDSSNRVYITGHTGTVVYDQFGNELWNKTGYTGMDIVLDPLGNIYIAGYRHNSGSSWDYLTIKYDSNGNEIWSTEYNGLGNSYDEAFGIAIDQIGNVFVTGYSPGIGTFNDYATIAYDSNGNELWIARYNGPADYQDYARAIAIDAIGDLYVTGKSYRTSSSSSYTTIKYEGYGNPSVLSADINIDPNTLNLKSKGRWITCYIELPEDYNINEIDITAISLEEILPCALEMGHSLPVGDNDGNGLLELSIKFDRSEVEDILLPGTHNFKVTGELTDGTVFEGYSDEIRVIHHSK